MNPSQVLERVLIDGLTLTISSDQNIKITGDHAFIDEWLPLIRQHKAAIIELLKKDLRKQRVLEMLAGEPGKKYAVLVTDATTDPVRVMVAIRSIAAFELQIPQAHYDGIALLEVLEQHSTDTALKLSGECYPLSQLKERSQTRAEQLQRKVA
jgi:hypothetical protein